MTFNRIQFQPGMSLPEFLRCFGTEAHCAAALMAARWPAGFHCPRCSSDAHCLVGQGTRRLFQCNGCRHQTSLTAGSLMEHTKLPLTTWFLAICLISQGKTGLSALALKRQLGVSYPTAWLLHQMINRAMAARESCHRREGAVQVNDAYLGGERAGGKPGRGSENKVPIVAAVSLDHKNRPRFLKLSMVSGFTSEAIGQWAKACLAPGCAVLSDGLACFGAVTDAGCTHQPVVVGVFEHDFSLWHAFGNRYWPAHYFVDARGRIRSHHFGEGAYEKSEQVIRQLLDEARGQAKAA